MSRMPESNDVAEQRRRRGATAAIGKTTMKAAPMNDAADRGEAADDDDEQDLERAVEVEAGRLDGAEIGEGPEHAGDADDEGADREGEELGLQHRHADHLGGESRCRGRR